MSTLRAYLGVAGLTDVGYRFYTQNTAAGARQTSGIVDEGEGWYSIAGATLAGDHVRWDSTGDASAVAREDLVERIILETNLNATVSSRSSHSAADVWASGTRSLTTFGALVADVATAVWASGTRTLTAFESLISDIWSAVTRTLTSASGASAADVADAVWDEAIAGHMAVGSTGEKLSHAGNSADPWGVQLPGSYPPGSGGDIIGALADIDTQNITVSSPVSKTGNAIIVRAGDSWSIPITGLGNIATPTKLWFAVNKQGLDDSKAKLFIEKTAGLTVVNGAVHATPGNGSLTVNDATLGNITIAVDEVVTKLLEKSATWAVKMLRAGDTVTLATGYFAIAKFGVSSIA